MKRTLRTLALPAALAVVLTTSACGSSSSGDHSAGGSHASSSTAAGGATKPPMGDHNDADIDFATGMIPHHGQAIEMADLALARATTPEVKRLATQIKGAQDPEIRTMSGWLSSWGASMPSTGSEHDMSGHGATSGMMSAEEMKALAAATGPAFDRMWLDLMIRHHEGAVAMARTQLASGASADVKQLAQAVIDGQTKEIATMKGLLGAASG